MSHQRILAIIAATVLNTSVFAGGFEQVTSPHRYQGFIGLGYMDYLTGTKNKTFRVTSNETDQLSQSNQKNNIGYTAGFARVYALNKHQLSAVTLGLTLRYDPTTFMGQVYQYQIPSQNNFTYRYQLRPISELLESNLLFHPFSKLHATPYLVMGVGLTEVNLTFKESIQDPEATDPISASAWKVTGDLAAGAGLQWIFKHRYLLKAQYLFQYRGNAHVVSVPVNLDEQGADVLFGCQF